MWGDSGRCVLGAPRRALHPGCGRRSCTPNPRAARPTRVPRPMAQGCTAGAGSGPLGRAPPLTQPLPRPASARPHPCMTQPPSSPHLVAQKQQHVPAPKQVVCRYWCRLEVAILLGRGRSALREQERRRHAEQEQRGGGAHNGARADAGPLHAWGRAGGHSAARRPDSMYPGKVSSGKQDRVRRSLARRRRVRLASAGAGGPHHAWQRRIQAFD